MNYSANADVIFRSGSRYAFVADAAGDVLVTINGRQFSLTKGVNRDVFVAIEGYDRLEFNSSLVYSVSIYHIPVINTVSEYLTGERSEAFCIDDFGTRSLPAVDLPNYGLSAAGISYAGPWVSSASYTVGQVVDFKYDGDISYYQCITASSGQVPITSTGSVSNKWRPIKNLSIEFNYGPPVAGGVEYVVSKVDYLNIPGHRRQDYTEYEVAGAIVGNLTNIFTFAKHDGPLAKWISSSSSSIDIVPDSTGDIRIPSIANALGAPSRRNISGKQYDAPRARQDSDTSYWSIALSTVGRRGMSASGMKLPCVRSWPQHYNSKFDTGTVQALPNTMYFQLLGQPDWIPVFDIYSPAWNYSTRYSNNIVLWQDHVAGRIEVISANAVRAYGYSDNPSHGETLTLYVAGRYHRLTVDTVINSPVYGKVITFNERDFYIDGARNFTISPSDVTGAAHDVVNLQIIPGRRYSCTSSSGTATSPLLAYSDKRLRKIDGTYMQFFQSGETAYTLTELSANFGVIYRHTSGSHVFSVDCTTTENSSGDLSYDSLVSAGIIRQRVVGSGKELGYSPVLDPSSMAFDLSGTYLKVTIATVEYLVKCDGLTKAAIRDYLLANPTVMPVANDIPSKSVVLAKKTGSSPSGAAGHMYVYLPTSGVVDGQEVSMSFMLYNRPEISAGTGPVGSNLMPLVYILSGGAAVQADPFLSNLSPYESAVSVGANTLPSICTVEFPMASGASAPTIAQLNCNGWKFVAGIYPYSISNVPGVNATEDTSLPLRVDVRFVYSTFNSQWSCIDYQARSTHELSAADGTIASGMVNALEYKSALGEWHSKSNLMMTPMAQTMHNRPVSVQQSDVEPFSSGYRIPWHNDLSVDWLNELCT